MAPLANAERSSKPEVETFGEHFFPKNISAISGEFEVIIKKIVVFYIILTINLYNLGIDPTFDGLVRAQVLKISAIVTGDSRRQIKKKNNVQDGIKFIFCFQYFRVGGSVKQVIN